MTDEGDIPSIQCKMSLRGPKSMIKVEKRNREVEKRKNLILPGIESGSSSP
jgi:hypothetical protein